MSQAAEGENSWCHHFCEIIVCAIICASSDVMLMKNQAFLQMHKMSLRLKMTPFLVFISTKVFLIKIMSLMPLEPGMFKAGLTISGSGGPESNSMQISLPKS